MSRKRKEYGLYRGDEVVAVGTIPELVEATGKSPKSLWWYKSPSARKRSKGKALILVLLEDD